MTQTLLLIGGFAASVFIGLMFLLAAADKLRHRDLLPGVIANYRLLPAGLVTPAAMVLPVAELLVGAALVLGERLVAPVAAAMLLLVFAAAMGINIVRGRRHIDCGCGHSALRQQLGWGMVARNVALSAVLGVRLAMPGALAAAELAVAVAAGVVMFVMMLMYNALRALAVQTAASGGARG